MDARQSLTALSLLTLLAAPAFAQSEEAKRPRLLMPLYAANVALNVLDLHSTRRALDAGKRESNPLMKHASFNTMVGAKIAASAATILIVEKLHKRNRVAAVGLMLAADIGLSAVVANNYRMTGRPKAVP